MPDPILRNITATWTTPFSSEVWERLGSLKRRASAEGDFVSLGPALPEEHEPRVAEVVVHRHDDQDLHWGLTVEPAPRAAPPEALAEHSRKLGGRAGLAALLVEALPNGIPAVATFRLRVLLPEADFTCAVVPADARKDQGHEVALRLGREARLEQVGYRFEGGAGGIEEVAVVYLHKQARYSMNVAATGPLKLGSPTWLPFASDVADLAVSAFFSQKPREKTS
jgi:hypothetical protein